MKQCIYCEYCDIRFGGDRLCHCKKSEHFGKEIIGDGVACEHIWSIILNIQPDGCTYEETDQSRA